MDRNEQLRDVTCWLGHDQAEWHRYQEHRGDRVVTVYESVCDCGETIRVTFADGRIIEEENIP